MNIQQIIDKAERIQKDWIKFDLDRKQGIKAKLTAGMKYLKDTLNQPSAKLTGASTANDERS